MRADIVHALDQSVAELIERAATAGVTLDPSSARFLCEEMMAYASDMHHHEDAPVDVLLLTCWWSMIVAGSVGLDDVTATALTRSGYGADA